MNLYGVCLSVVGWGVNRQLYVGCIPRRKPRYLVAVSLWQGKLFSVNVTAECRTLFNLIRAVSCINCDYNHLGHGGVD